MDRSQQKYNTLLRKAREAAGLTQIELAECINVSEKSVSRWENGQSLPQPAALRALCIKLAKTPEELGFGDPAQAPSGEEEQAALQYAEQEQCQEKQSQEAFPLPVPFMERSPVSLPRRSAPLLLNGIIVLVVVFLLSAVVLTALFHLPLPWQSNCGQPFSGVFHSPLDARWQWENPGESPLYHLNAQGPLSITASPHSDLNPHGNFYAPRILQPITGDFTMQTHLQFDPTKNFQSAGGKFPTK
jgi:transcriptional regulator with XRE-family HTH domain